MAGPLHYFQFPQREWLSDGDVRRLSLAGKGLLIDLMAYQWNEGCLPDDATALCRMVGADRKEFDKAWKEVRAMFVANDACRLQLPHLAAQYEATLAKVEKQKNRPAERQGGRPRGGDKLETRLKPKGFELETNLKDISEKESDTEQHTPLLEGGAGAAHSGRVALDEEKFEAFFKRFQGSYPKRGDGNYKWPKTKTALREILETRQATSGQIFNGLLAFAAFMERNRNADSEYVPMPPTWLAEGGWMDDYPTVLNVVKGGKALSPEEAEQASIEAAIRAGSLRRLADGRIV